MKDCCRNITQANPSDVGVNHHKVCPKYKTEKNRYLFYLSDAFDAYIPAPRLTDELECWDNLDAGESQHVEFKMCLMTDQEFDNLPDVS